MRSLYLFPFFLLALASTAQSFSKFRARLMPRGMDDQKQLLKGKVSIEEISETFTEATQNVVTSVSSQNGDSVTVTQKVTEAHIYAQELTISVENLNDHQKMVTHQETVIGALVSYISMINAISDSESGVTKCHQQLVEINTAFRSITSTYLAKGINLHSEFNKHPSSPQYDPDKFDALNLDPPFVDQANPPDADQVNPPAVNPATDDANQSSEE